MSPNLKQAAELIRQGQCVGMPTETVYGLAGDALNPKALARIFEIKERPTFDPLILHISPKILSRLNEWVTFKNPKQEVTFKKLSGKFWPGALTILFQKKPIVPDLATSGLPEVAIRMPNHPVAQALIDEVDRPLAAPSANKFGSISPTTSSHVLKELGSRVTLVLNGGSSLIGVESTVIRIHDDSIEILRPGGVSQEELTACTGLRVNQSTSSHGTLSASPGTLDNHYAPKTKLFLIPTSLLGAPIQDLKNWVWDLKKKHGAKKIAGIMLSASHRSKFETGSQLLADKWFSLSEKNQPTEIAHSLFAILREVDESGVDLIIAEPVTEKSGLWPAIEDRLKKASTKR
ncbi:MAG: threonylcarbamoyl-AMP synthase [Xanthomonadaceae bacterium]|nr:threonylcarbamoyl-AMP synthase [Xanthomonadaceae bacterium]